MAATYYAQILRMFRWQDMVAAMAKAKQNYIELATEFPDKLPDDAEARVNGVLATATHTNHLFDYRNVVDAVDGLETSVYLGSVFNIMPSGKYYMPWTTNQTDDDVRKDAAFLEALEKVAEKFGGWISSGEGDPTDMFFMGS